MIKGYSQWERKWQTNVCSWAVIIQGCVWMSVFMDECVWEWVSMEISVHGKECVRERVCTWTSVYVNKCVCERVCMWTSVYVDECVREASVNVNEWVCEWVLAPANGTMNCPSLVVIMGLPQGAVTGNHPGRSLVLSGGITCRDGT